MKARSLCTLHRNRAHQSLNSGVLLGVGVVIFTAFILMFMYYWKHNPVNWKDRFWAKYIDKIVLNEEDGDTGRDNFGQKGRFWAAIISLVLLLVSGIVI